MFECDGNQDCRDGSDEHRDCSEWPKHDYYIYLLLNRSQFILFNCVTLMYLGCDNDEFRCTNGRCIDEDRECDGFSDCTDDSDEHSGCGMSLFNLCNYKYKQYTNISQHMFEKSSG